MATEIRVPRLGWSMDEGTLVELLRSSGAVVRAGEPLFVLEGDKAAEEIESLEAGIVQWLDGGPSAGDRVQVGQLLGYLLSPGESRPAVVTAEPPRPVEKAVEVAAAKPVLRRNQRPLASPRARRVARELGLNLTGIAGTGRGGRIRERDVRAGAQRSLTDVGVTGSPLRRVIAERMRDSHLTTAPVTLHLRVDAENLVSLRKQFQSSRSAPDSVAPSYTDILVKLTALVLRDHPLLTSSWDEGQVVMAAGIHLGIAVDTPAGLMVPVVRDADRISLRELAARSRELVERARAHRLTAEEQRGGTFTLTNLGAWGIETFTPLIQLPQCAVLGIGQIAAQAVVVERQVVARQTLSLSLTFDHRLVDGAPAARFLSELRMAVENPAERLIA